MLLVESLALGGLGDTLTFSQCHSKAFNVPKFMALNVLPVFHQDSHSFPAPSISLPLDSGVVERQL